MSNDNDFNYLNELIDSWFSTLPVTDEKRNQMIAIKNAAKQFAFTIALNTPQCREQYKAFDNVRSAAMGANLAITTSKDPEQTVLADKQ